MIDRKIAEARYDLEKRLRKFLDENGFCEIKTPIHSSSFDAVDFKKCQEENGCSKQWRPCMELDLRVAMASGLEAIYELGPCFRHDQVDSSHLQEFHMLELFWNKPDFKQLLELSRQILAVALKREIAEFDEINVEEMLMRHYPELDLTAPDRDLRRMALEALPAAEHKGELDKTYQVLNKLIDRLFREEKPGTLDRPVMLTHYPAATICVANPCPDAPHLIERAEFFIEGIEVGHGFIDDMDAERVRRRMMENGEEFLDIDLLDLLEAKKLPASSGVGFGFERLLMLAEGIRDIRKCVHKLKA